MENRKPVTEWKPTVNVVLDSKVKELLMIGYSEASREDVWKCLSEGVWEDRPTKKLYEVVQDIFHLKPSDYMNYLTVNAFKEGDLMASISALTDETTEDL